MATNIDPYARRSTNAAASWIRAKKKNDQPELTEPQGGEITEIKVPKIILPKKKKFVWILISIPFKYQNQTPQKNLC